MKHIFNYEYKYVITIWITENDTLITEVMAKATWEAYRKTIIKTYEEKEKAKLIRTWYCKNFKEIRQIVRDL